jgi:fatty-acyl-CoA synthase
MIDFNAEETPTLWKRWLANSIMTPDREAIVHWIGGEEPVRWTYKELIHAAKKFSVMIKKMGIKKGDVCAIIIRHNPFFYPLYMGISRTGALPAVLAYPNPRLHPDKFRQGIEGMSQRSGLDYILTERELEPLIAPLTEKEGSTIKAIYFPLEWDLDAAFNQAADEEIENFAGTIKETAPLLLQHSSGTTGLQKPVVLSHRAILNHVKYYGKSIRLSETDKVASWLPLYHDMGLIAAFHIPLAYGITSVQISPFEWVVAPILLLEAITKEKATACYLPNFAYNILAEKIDEDEMTDISLNTIRLVVNCSEPVRDESHKKFASFFQKYGLDKKSLSACYAMAETTYAITQTEPDAEITVIQVDRLELANGKIKPVTGSGTSKTCVSSGKLIEQCEIKIVDENRNEIKENLVGEIAVKSVSMFDGYRNYPEKTADVMRDGWYFTGDYGFKYKNEFFIIGRKKDIIIVAGKNLYPEDIEDTVNQVEGVTPGRIIAFGEEDTSAGTELVSVVAETKFEDDKEKNKLRIDILKAGMSIDVNIHKVYLVPPRWLIKSSAGKPSRKANKERLISGSDPLVWSR